MWAELGLLQRGESIRGRRSISKFLSVASGIFLGCTAIALITSAVVLLVRKFSPNNGLSSKSEANRFYRLGEYKIHSMTPAEVQAALTNFTEAVLIDPHFARAYFGLFQVYLYGSDDTPEIRPLAEKLNVVAPGSVEALTVSSYVHWLDWQFDEAIKEAKQASRRNPKWPWSHGLCGFYLLHARGQAEEALKEYSAAAENDATSPVFQHHLGHPFYFQRQFTNAIERYERSLRLESRHSTGDHWLGRSYQALKDFERAIDHFQARDIKRGTDAAKAQQQYDQLREAFRSRGETGYWKTQLDTARTSSSFNPYDAAVFHVHLGMTNEALTLLEEAYKQHRNDMVYLLFDEHWDALRDNDRFRAIVKRVGLSQTE